MKKKKKKQHILILFVICVLVPLVTFTTSKSPANTILDRFSLNSLIFIHQKEIKC